jgi:hypothetical protein
MVMFLDGQFELTERVCLNTELNPCTGRGFSTRNERRCNKKVLQVRHKVHFP